MLLDTRNSFNDLMSRADSLLNSAEMAQLKVAKSTGIAQELDATGRAVNGVGKEAMVVLAKLAETDAAEREKRATKVAIAMHIVTFGAKLLDA